MESKLGGDVLLQSLEDSDWRVRNEASLELSRMPEPVVGSELRRLLCSGTVEARAAAAWILGKMGASSGTGPGSQTVAAPKFSVCVTKVVGPSLTFYPSTLPSKPQLPSPFLTADGEECVVVRIRDGRSGVVPITLGDNEAKGRQLWVNADDLPARLSAGVHDPSELAQVGSITGRSLVEVTELARPGSLSDSSFLTADENILSVLRGGNALVKKLGLIHPDLARPLFHVWNLIFKPREGPSIRRWTWNVQKLSSPGEALRLPTPLDSLIWNA